MKNFIKNNLAKILIGVAVLFSIASIASAQVSSMSWLRRIGTGLVTMPTGLSLGTTFLPISTIYTNKAVIPPLATPAGSFIAVNQSGEIIATSTPAVGGGGTVTSVGATGGTTGLLFSGSPIISAGTFILNGILNVANGGTGASTFPYGLLSGNGTGALTHIATSTLGILTTNVAEGTNLYYTNARVSANSSVIANTAKTGITPTQTSDIITNNAKVGITPTQSSAITNNTAKVGITTAQASDITANNAKIGITSGQSSAIVSNTAKVGITTSQASAITTNTAKVGITTTQSGNITTNNTKVTESTSVTAPLVLSGYGISLPASSATANGYLSSTDWSTFNSKLSSFTETDPIYTASQASNITSTDITNLGNLSGTNTGDQTTITGNAGTATTLQTARLIAGVSFNGSADISLNNNAITNGAGYTTNTGTVTSVATDATLTGGAITTTGTLGFNLSNANTWIGAQSFGTAIIPSLGTPAGTFLAVNASGQIIATTTPSGGGAVSSISNLDGSLTISPTTGVVLASINPANANTWTSTQNFNVSPNIATNTNGITLGGKTFAYASSTNRAVLFGINAGGNLATTSATTLGITAFGYHALQSTQEPWNEAFGSNALANNTTGKFNHAFGDASLYSNTTGSYNTAFGEEAINLNYTGNSNTAVGNDAMKSTLGSFNTGMGAYTLETSSGSNNTAVGYGAGNGTSGIGTWDGNSIFGANSMPAISTGDYNNAFGYNSALNLTTGSSNIILGSYVNAPSATANQQLNIGNLIYGTGIYGGTTNSATAVVGGKIGIGTTTPLSTLTVSGGTSVGADYNISAPTNGLVVEGNVGIGTTTPYRTLSVNGFGAITGTLFVGIPNSTDISTYVGTGILSKGYGAPYSYGGIGIVGIGDGNSNSYASGTGVIGIGENCGSFFSKANCTGGSFTATNGTINSIGVSSSATGGVSGNYSFYGSNGIIYNKDSVGIGSTTPYAKLSVSSLSMTLPIFALATSTARTLMKIDANGHLITGGISPTCGTGCASVSGDDRTMRVVAGTSVSSVTVNFANTYTNTPVCIANEESGGVVNIEASSTPTTVVLDTGSAISGQSIAVICQISNNFTN